MGIIDDAFQSIHREDFLPARVRTHAQYDTPISIGYGQTNSQPSTVLQMLEWLEARPGDKVLDVGSGSGWTTALLATIVGPKGSVYAVERIPELVEFGRGNCQRLAIPNAHFCISGDTIGLPEEAPFDRILVSASATEMPEALIAQLTLHGRLVIPIRESILVVTKKTDTDLEIIEHPGYIFVPLLT